MDPQCTALVIFGITGDLARKKTFGVLYDLAVLGRLDIAVIGVGRSDWTSAKLRSVAQEAIRHGRSEGLDEGCLKVVLDALEYVQGDYASPALYDALAARVKAEPSVLAYLAVPPTVFGDIVDGLAPLDAGTGRIRLLIEKPFGSDLASARELLARVRSHFRDAQLFAVDHYLEKESLQNLMVLRFANRVLEPAWNAEHIESVAVTMAEDFGIEGRAGFFDQNGTMRDVVQNHVLQIVTALAMEPPASASADDVNDRRVELLASVADIGGHDVVFGQYDGYLGTEGVAEGSQTDTFVRARVRIDNERWRGVEWTLTAGKALAQTATDVMVTFRPLESAFIAEGCAPQPNQLHIAMAPEESVSMCLQARSASLPLGTTGAELATGDGYRPQEHVDAYARMFDDARRGDHTAFVRPDVVEESWRIVDAALRDRTPPVVYPKGSTGPSQQPGR